MKPVRDLSQLFTLLVLFTWAIVVAVPLFLSLALGQSAGGLPLVGVLLWFGVVRVGRSLSPAARADALMRRGHYAEALELCDQALAVQGEGAWVGARRLVWLNRRTTALLALGRADDGARSALEAIEVSADPQTLGNCALALLRLNRYEEASSAARLTLTLTRERSVLAHGTLASVMLAQGKPAEAEALAHAGVEDARALLPLVRQEHYVLCLAALCRAAREVAREPLPPQRARMAQQREEAARRYLEELRAAARQRRLLPAVALTEAAESLSAAKETQEQAQSALETAMRLWPEYVLWLIAQPGTFARLRGDERFGALAARAAARMAELQAGAPSERETAASLAAAKTRGRARPARQSSSLALIAQVITLGSTFTLLLLWTWRFFIALS
jgi:tetratricopeptide (TPR) repeat protein